MVKQFVWIKYKKYNGLLTNDFELIEKMENTEDFEFYYEIFRKNVKIGVAYIYKKEIPQNIFKTIIKRMRCAPNVH